VIYQQSEVVLLLVLLHYSQVIQLMYLTQSLKVLMIN
jgi:hypothetical protein